MKSLNRRIAPLKLVLAFLYILIFPALILGLGGDWRWTAGWIFDAWFILLCAATIIYLALRDPALLAERFRKPGTGSQKGWDKYVVLGLVIGFAVWIAIMPLDAKRLGWSPAFPVWLMAAGGAGLLASSFFFYRAYRDNPFLSPLVRIQKERGHSVVSSGVYGVVRHPMYLGAVLLFVGTPVLLGSLYGLVAGLLLTVLLASRIIGEEKMLVKDLAGYIEYRQKVKFRLIPFIW